MRSAARYGYESVLSVQKEYVMTRVLFLGHIGAGIDVHDLEDHIDELAAEVWGLTNDELKDMKESLEEIR
jgi:hypothetical protein